MGSIKKATVTTLRDADAVLPSFVHYHLQTGFDHLFLFFDDPHADIPAWIKNHPQISAYARDEALEDAWLTTSCFTMPQISRSIDSEAMSRQILNAELALREAFHKGIHWLLHLDVDELFYVEDATVDAHFQHMTQQGIDCVSYANMEGIPEQLRIDNFFRKVSLFKINPEYKPNASLISKNQSFLDQITEIPQSFFHYYSSYKSAVRVTPNTLPRGVHNFSTPHNGKRIKCNEGPFILHYPCCGIDHFIRKYKTLGTFGDRWFGQGGQTHINLPSHLNGRDVVGTNDEEAITAYYADHFVCASPDMVEALITRGLCRRITAPSTLMQPAKRA